MNKTISALIPDWADAPANIGALSTLRDGGASRAPYDDGYGGGGFNLGLHVGDQLDDVEQNRAQLRRWLPAQPAWLTQVHGTRVTDAAGVTGTPQADASFTTQTGVVCAILTADCLPVLFCNAAGTVVAAAHAGWRGLAGGVLENTVDAMRNASADGSDILAWLGPAIGPQRFEVGGEVVAIFCNLDTQTQRAFTPIIERPGKYLADIYQLARIRLAGTGVHKICGGDSCTATDEQRFYSYRRDGVTGRMASLIWIE